MKYKKRSCRNIPGIRISTAVICIAVKQNGASKNMRNAHVQVILRMRQFRLASPVRRYILQFLKDQNPNAKVRLGGCAG